MKTRKTRFKCVLCGKITAGRIPRNGDKSMRFPRRHNANGKPCPGNVEEAKWVEEDEIGNFIDGWTDVIRML